MAEVYKPKIEQLTAAHQRSPNKRPPEAGDLFRAGQLVAGAGFGLRTQIAAMPGGKS
jgi:hypothetical protein